MFYDALDRLSEIIDDPDARNADTGQERCETSATNQTSREVHHQNPKNGIQSAESGYDRPNPEMLFRTGVELEEHATEPKDGGQHVEGDRGEIHGALEYLAHVGSAIVRMRSTVVTIPTRRSSSITRAR